MPTELDIQNLKKRVDDRMTRLKVIESQMKHIPDLIEQGEILKKSLDVLEKRIENWQNDVDSIG